MYGTDVHVHRFVSDDDGILIGLPLCRVCGGWYWQLMHERPQIKLV